jgi:glycosyltransferase involved in cell wall biosynthesis
MPVDVSVVVPTFRRRQPLREALESALSQKGITTEVIVVDDDAEGSAAAVVDEIGDPRIRYLKCEPVSGGNPAVTRNVGWPSATGRYVHFLDDDDVVLPGAHRDMVEALDAAPDKGMVFGVVEPFGADDEVVKKERAYFMRAARMARVSHRFDSRRLRSAFMLFRTTMLVNSACMIRRTCIASLGGYKPEIRVVEDVDFYARAIRHFGSVFLDRPVIGYRCGAPSIMSGQKDSAVIESSYEKMHRAYRQRYGFVEFAALKTFSRTVLRFLLTVLTFSPVTADAPESLARSEEVVNCDSSKRSSSEWSITPSVLSS